MTASTPEWTKWKPLFNSHGQLNQLTNEFLGFDKVNENGYKIGGCYMFAYSEEDISNIQAAPSQSFIEYIGAGGSSTKSGMIRRTNDFRSSITGSSRYGNGVQFIRKYGFDKRINLYVAYFPLGFEIRKQIAHDCEIAFQEIYKHHNGGKLPSLHILEEEILEKKIYDAKRFIQGLNSQQLNDMKQFISKL